MTPILMWVFPIYFLIPIVMCAEVFGGILLSRRWLVHAEDKARLWKMLFFSAICLPIGISVGAFIPVTTLKIFTSVLVLFFSAYLLFKPHFNLPVSSTLDSLAGGLSGLLLGTCGIGGPPAALYLNATNQAFQRTRSLLSHFISGISLLAILAASLMGGGFGWLSFLPAAIFAYWVGMRVAQYLLLVNAISDAAIKKVCLLLLITNSGFNLLLLLIS